MVAATIVAMDGNWLVHRAASVNSKMEPEQMARVTSRQVTRWAFQYAIRHRATHFFVGFDGGQCYRNEVYPFYKIGRKKAITKDGRPLSNEEKLELLKAGKTLRLAADDPVHLCREASSSLLTAFGVPVEHHSRYEADDLLASAAALADRKDVSKVVVVTKDKDTLGALRPKCIQWYPDPATKTEVSIPYEDLSNRLASYVHQDASSWTPKQFRDYQILVGDGIDDIPEIMSKVSARKLLNKHGTLKAFFETPDGSQWFRKNQGPLTRNLALVSLVSDIFEDQSLDEWVYRRPETLSNVSQSITDLVHEYTSMGKALSRPRLFGPR